VGSKKQDSTEHVHNLSPAVPSMVWVPLIGLLPSPCLAGLFPDICSFKSPRASRCRKRPRRVYLESARLLGESCWGAVRGLKLHGNREIAAVRTIELWEQTVDSRPKCAQSWNQIKTLNNYFFLTSIALTLASLGTELLEIPAQFLTLSTALKFASKFFRKRSFFDQKQQPLTM